MQSVPAAFPGGDEAREVQHAIDMLVELIPDAHDRAYPVRVQRACRESFAMNARLLIDFVTGDSPRDILASHFVDGAWNRPERVGDVGDVWKWASANVAHTSKERTQDLTYDVAEARMLEIARVVVVLLDGWVTAVERSAHPDAAALRSSIVKAQSLLA